MIAWGDNQLALSLDGDDDTAADAIVADTNGRCKTAAQVGRLLELLRCSTATASDWEARTPARRSSSPRRAMRLRSFCRRRVRYRQE